MRGVRLVLRWTVTLPAFGLWMLLTFIVTALIKWTDE